MITSKECAIISAIKFNGYKIELSENILEWTAVFLKMKQKPG